MVISVVFLINFSTWLWRYERISVQFLEEENFVYFVRLRSPSSRYGALFQKGITRILVVPFWDNNRMNATTSK